MNKTERLILLNQVVIMQSLGKMAESQNTRDNLATGIAYTEKALAPQSTELYEKDIEDPVEEAKLKDGGLKQ